MSCDVGTELRVTMARLRESGDCVRRRYEMMWNSECNFLLYNYYPFCPSESDEDAEGYRIKP